MRVLVGTMQTQGRRANDFAYVAEGELVMLGFECDGEKVDGACGCRRSFIGVEDRRATTTAMVVEREMTVEQYRETLFESEKKAWGSMIAEHEKEARSDCDVLADDLLRLAAGFPVGAVVEKRGPTFRMR